MNGKALREKLQFYVDDASLSATQELDLINQAYQVVCTDRYWHFLTTEDTSNTLANGTTAYSLPADFLYLNSVDIYDTSSKSRTSLKVIPFQKRMDFLDEQGYCYIDHKNQNVVLLSSAQAAAQAGKTLIINYQYQPANITESTEPVFATPFHDLLALEGAMMFWINDQQDNGEWYTKTRQNYEKLKQEMIRWDYTMAMGTDNQWYPDEWVDLTS